jgi:hypothetical protein
MEDDLKKKGGKGRRPQKKRGERKTTSKKSVNGRQTLFLFLKNKTDDLKKMEHNL